MIMMRTPGVYSLTVPKFEMCVVTQHERIRFDSDRLFDETEGKV